MSDAPRTAAAPEWAVASRQDLTNNEGLRGGWTSSPAPLLRGHAYTDFGRHHMAVPTGDDLASQGVRVHEMLHASLSPSFVPPELAAQYEVSSDAIVIAEELRMNIVARDLAEKDAMFGSVRHMEDGTETRTAQRLAEAKDWRASLSLFVGTYGTNAHAKVRRALSKARPEWRDALSSIAKTLRDNSIVTDDYYAKARASTLPTLFRWTADAKKMTAHTEEVTLPRGFATFTLSMAHAIEDWLNGRAHARGVLGDDADKKGRGRDRGGEDDQVVGESDGWETLRFGLTSLTEPTTRFLGRRRRPSATGKFPRRPDRLLTDPERRVFSEIVRGEGATVIFDCSGSMGVDYDDVLNAVRQFAGARVIVYSLGDRHEPNAWIVADRGRMVTAEEFRNLDLNRGNGVDGPVLRWALRHRRNRKEPIVWMSDGGVSGKGDRFGDGFSEECYQLVTKFGIVNPEDTTQAREVLAHARRFGTFPKDALCRKFRFRRDRGVPFSDH